MFMQYLFVFIGAGIGGCCRFAMSPFVQRLSNGGNFPIGTFSVNMLGCLVIGLLAQLSESRSMFQGDTRLFLFVGILGGFTTFSSYGLETFQLIRDGQIGLAIANAVGQVVLGLLFVWFGWLAGRLVA